MILPNGYIIPDISPSLESKLRTLRAISQPEDFAEFMEELIRTQHVIYTSKLLRMLAKHETDFLLFLAGDPTLSQDLLLCVHYLIRWRRENA